MFLVKLIASSFLYLIPKRARPECRCKRVLVNFNQQGAAVWLSSLHFKILYCKPAKCYKEQDYTSAMVHLFPCSQLLTINKLNMIKESPSLQGRHFQASSYFVPSHKRLLNRKQLSFPKLSQSHCTNFKFWKVDLDLRVTR